MSECEFPLFINEIYEHDPNTFVPVDYFHKYVQKLNILFDVNLKTISKYTKTPHFVNKK